MGGRGPSVVKAKKPEWGTLPASVLGVNKIMGCEIIRYKNSVNAKTPLVIGKKNAIELISDNRGKISQIAVYANLAFSVDLDYSRGPHGHKADEHGRVSHDPNNIYMVPKRYEKLLGKVAEHNLVHFGITLPKNRKTYPDVEIGEYLRQRRREK